MATRIGVRLRKLEAHTMLDAKGCSVCRDKPFVRYLDDWRGGPPAAPAVCSVCGGVPPVIIDVVYMDQWRG